jgi:hypothetical protein
MRFFFLLFSLMSVQFRSQNYDLVPCILLSDLLINLSSAHPWSMNICVQLRTNNYQHMPTKEIDLIKFDLCKCVHKLVTSLPQVEILFQGYLTLYICWLCIGIGSQKLCNCFDILTLPRPNLKWMSRSFI